MAALTDIVTTNRGRFGMAVAGAQRGQPSTTSGRRQPNPAASRTAPPTGRGAPSPYFSASTVRRRAGCNAIAVPRRRPILTDLTDLTDVPVYPPYAGMRARAHARTHRAWPVKRDSR